MARHANSTHPQVLPETRGACGERGNALTVLHAHRKIGVLVSGSIHPSLALPPGNSAMKDSPLGEFELIARLAARLPASTTPGGVGIGDDTAAIPHGDGMLLLTCDIAMEGRHFVRGLTPMADVGWKVATSNASDVAACGGLPAHALISLGVPEDATEAEMDALYEGIAEAGRRYGFEVLGGNVTGAEKLMVDCFMTGTAPAFISRGGARAGQLLCVSGTLGDSSAGLELLSTTPPTTSNTGEEKALLSRHLRPLARTDLVPLLREAAGAAIDISDSLASELHHMAAASGVQLAVDGESLPVSKELEAFASARKEDPRERALFGGEDYQILFSAPAEFVRTGGAKDFTIIGEVRRGEGVLLSGRPLPNRGWDHLRKQRPRSP